MQIKIGSDGPKSCLATYSGRITTKFIPESILSFDRLKPVPARMRLDSVTFAIQEKMGFNLWWAAGATIMDWHLIMPIESRGYFDLEKAGGIHSPPGAFGIGLSCFRNTDPDMTFMFILDLTKQFD
jgi:hypothetical protein